MADKQSVDKINDNKKVINNNNRAQLEKVPKYFRLKMSSLPKDLHPLDYEFLLKNLTQGTPITRAQSLKRFNTLVVTDKKQFSIYAKRVVLAIQELMFESKEDINLLASNLTLQIINLNPREIQYYVRSKLLKQVVKNLGDQKPQIRKTSHYCLLAYVKTYKSFDQLFQVYLSVGVEAEQWQLRQKAVNSLQSIIIMEMKHLNWGSNQFKRIFETLLIKLKDQNVYVQKAIEQCLLSLCKMEELRTFCKKLIPQHLQILKNFLEKQFEAGTIQQIKLDLEEKKLTLPSPMKMSHQNRQQSNMNLSNIRNSLLNLEKIKMAQENSQKRAIINRVEEIRRNNSTMHTPKIEKQQVQVLRKGDSMMLAGQFKEMRKNTPMNQRSSQIKLQPIRKQPPLEKEREKQEIPIKQEKYETITNKKLIEDLRNDKDWKVRLQAIQELQSKFNSNKQLFDMQSLTKIYIPTLIKLLGDGNFKVALISLKIIQELLMMPNMSLEQIVPHLSQRLSDNKIALRQNISKLIRSEYIRTRQPIWIEGLLSQLKKSTNSNTKEEILSILSKLYQQKDAPNYSMIKVIQSVCPLMDDLKTKIKIKTLDLLVLVTLKANNRDEMKNLLMAKLNQVYYEMYSEKLFKEIKNKEKDKETYNNLSTDDSLHATATRGVRAATIQNKRYSKNTGNTTTTSLQRDKSSKFDPKDTVRTSSFIQKTSKPDLEIKVSQSLENSNSKISLGESDSAMRSPQRKKSLLKSFRKKTHRSSNYQSTNYSTGEEFEPFSDPEKQLKNILIEIKSDDWEVSLEALNKTRRIIAHHSQLLTQDVVKQLVPEIMRLVENLRSTLSKNAVVTLNELAAKVKKGLDSEIDLIFNKLIKKSLDANSFISEEVKKVLVTVCSNCNENKVVSLLTTAHTSRAIPIKQVVAHILQCITFLPKIFDKELQRVVVILNNFMSEGSLQIRQKTKAILTEILSSQKCKNVMRLISAQHLAKLKKQTDEKIIPELKVIQKEQPQSEKKEQQVEVNDTSVLKKKKKQKISVFPDQFNQVQGLLEKCESSDWKVRLESMNEINQIYTTHPEQASQHRLNTKFIDVLSKQIGDPNVKVATSALRIFKNLISVIPGLIQNNLSVVSNEVFNCFASQKQEVKILAQQFFDELSIGIESWMLLQHMCNGILYGLQKSKPVIIEKLDNIVLSALKSKPNIFQKNVYPMLNKVAEEGKPQLLQPLKKLAITIYQEVGENCMDYLKPKVKLLIKS